MGVNLDSIYEQEPDAGLGSGGLGRFGSMLFRWLGNRRLPCNGVFFAL